MSVVPSICRSCLAFCPILVTVEDGRAVKVVGDPDAHEYEGYICPKGRALPAQTYSSDRLLNSLQRTADGTVTKIPAQKAVEEIASRLQEIIARHGPRAVALYFGNSTAPNPSGALLGTSWLRAIGSPMLFTATTIDKPAEKTAMAMHGYWMGGGQSFEDADVWMIVGANPVIAKSNGAPFNNPGMRLKTATRDGMKLIVVDPRRSETAKRAHVHLQCRPGEDPTLLAGIIHIIIAEQLYDQDFVASDVQGFQALADAIASFNPQYVAARADVPVADLLEAARTFGRARHGMVSCGTGPSFSTRSNLSFYLSLCLNTICGRWAREGDRAVYPNVLRPAYVPKAQAMGPYSPFGPEQMRVMGLRESVAGMPTAALPDEILTEGEGQVKALICVAGNPMSSFPDQRKTEAALNALDLFVCLDVLSTPTTELADYVIAPPMHLELPAMTYPVESLKYLGPGRGLQHPWAQYTPAATRPPAGADLMEEHVFFFRLAQAMGVQLNWTSYHGMGRFVESPGGVTPLDMNGPPPTLDELFELATANARVPLSEVKKYPHGHRFPIDIPIAPRDPEWNERLEVGNTLMMSELFEVAAEEFSAERAKVAAEYPFQFISRRVNNSMNSVGTNLPELLRDQPYNPAFMHPADLADLRASDGDVVIIRSVYGQMLAVARTDDTLRRNTVSMTHGFGARGDAGERNPLLAGTNVNLVIHMDECDPMTGIPRMSAQPVAVTLAQ